MDMIKLAIKLLVVLAILNAGVRSAAVAWDFYQFKDAAQQVALFGTRTPPATLRTQVLNKAEEFGIAIAPEQIVIKRQGASTTIETSYVEAVELFPSYVRELPLRFSVEGFDPVAAPLSQ